MIELVTVGRAQVISYVERLQVFLLHVSFLNIEVTLFWFVNKVDKLQTVWQPEEINIMIIFKRLNILTFSTRDETKNSFSQAIVTEGVFGENDIVGRHKKLLYFVVYEKGLISSHFLRLPFTLERIKISKLRFSQNIKYKYTLNKLSVQFFFNTSNSL